MADLEAEWPELGKSWFFGPQDADDDRRIAWFYPVLLLYAGFFFGPFITFVFAVAAVRGRLDLRRAGLLLGVSGTAWCMLQGVSLYNGAWWTEVELQAMRSILNFGAGIVAYIVVRPIAVDRYRQTPRTLVTTIALIIACAVLFILLPPGFLVALGR